jgi:hypothetical protein
MAPYLRDTRMASSRCIGEAGWVIVYQPRVLPPLPFPAMVDGRSLFAWGMMCRGCMFPEDAYGRHDPFARRYHSA